MKRFGWLVLLLVPALLVPACVRAHDGPAPVAIIDIPAIDLMQYVETAHADTVEGQRTFDLTALGDGIAWMEGTGWVQHPNGRIIIGGHTPGGFERLVEVEIGDRIYLITEAGLARYRVTAVQTVTADDTSLWNSPGGGQSLLLITCEGTHRRIVVAERRTP